MLEPPRLRYLEVASQANAYSQQEVDAHVSYWREALTGAPPVVDLPTVRPRPPIQTTRGATTLVTIPAELTEDLRRFSRANRASVFMTLLAGFAGMLGRYTQQPDLVLGTPVTGRHDSRTERTVASLANLVPLRIRADGAQSFAEVLRGIRAVCAEALDHQELPWEVLVDRLRPERAPSHSPIFQVVVGYRLTNPSRLSLPSAEAFRDFVSTETAKFDLVWNVVDDGSRMWLEAEYRTDLFDATTVDRMAGQWLRLLTAAVAAPGTAVGDLDLLSLGEWRWLVAAGDGGVVAGRGVLSRFAEQVALRPDGVAVCGEGGSLTYGQLAARADAVAVWLRASGVGVEDRVGLCLPRSVDMVVAVLGVWRAGAAYVPVDPEYPAARVEFVLRDAGVKVVLCVDGTRGCVPVGDWGVVGLEEVGSAVAVPAELVSEPVPESLAYVIYTSGSTGTPKGVQVSHRNLAALLSAGSQMVTPTNRDVWTLFHSVAFDFSVWEMWGALAFGGRLVIVPYLVSRTPQAFYDLLVRESVTVLNQTPSAFRQLVAEDSGRPSDRLRLRLIIFGGEAIDPGSVREWYRRYDVLSPQMVNMYGITETTVHVTHCDLFGLSETLDRSPIGRAMPGWRALVLDSRGQLVPVGVPGELHIGGAGLARGYLGRPSLTADRFVPDPFATEPGTRLYRTGDLARWGEDGTLEYLGRADHQVKVRGFRIEPEEIEVHLSKHPAVGACVVTADGEREHRRLLAYVVAAEAGRNGTVSSDMLRAWLGQRLPAHLVPAVIISLDALPLTPSGKVDRRALPSPDLNRSTERGTAYVPPRTPTERLLADAWAEVLQVDDVGVGDNFFDLGGDSIRSIQVVGAAHRRGLPLTVRHLFEHLTIAEIGQMIHEEGEVARPASRPAPFSMLGPDDADRLPEGIEDAYPMTALQAGMVYHMASDTETMPYLNIDSYRVRGDFDEEAFRRAVQAVVSRHPVLRTTFDLVGYSEPMQMVHRWASVPIVVEDLRHLSADVREAAVDALVRRERQTPFDLNRPPLLRFFVQRLSDSQFQWTIVEHHAILDGWSLWSTISEILAQYSRLLAGEDLRISAPPESTYRDFVELERQAAASVEAERFWTSALSGYAGCALLADHWAPAAPASARSDVKYLTLTAGAIDRYGWHDLRLPEKLAQGLEETARRLGVTPKSILLAAHLQVLAAQSGQRDVCCGLTLNGRLEEPDAAEVRGLFLNTVPFRLLLAAGSRRDLVRRVFESERAMMPHRRMPLSRINQVVGAEQLFATNFVYINFHVLRDSLTDSRVRLLATDEDLSATRRLEPADVPLTVAFFKNPPTGELLLYLDFDTERLDPGRVSDIAAEHIRALELLVEEPDGTVEQTSVLSLGEWRWLVAAGDGGVVAGRGVLSRFAEQVALRPDGVAVCGEGGSLTYGQLAARADAVAVWLRASGVGVEDRVGLCLPRSVDMVVAVLGVWRAGAAYVPVDPEYPAARVEFVLRDAGVKVVLCVDGTRGCVPVGDWGVVGLEEVGSAVAVPAELVSEPVPESLAYVIYTSGSTGTPKGVQVGWNSLNNLVGVADRVLDLASDDRLLTFASLCFDVSVVDLVGAVASGATCVVSPGGDHRVGPGLRQALLDFEPTVLSLPPSVLALLDPADLSGLRRVVVAGEALPPALAASWRRVAEVVNAYGPTEATVYATSYMCERDDACPIGRPVPGTTAYVLDGFGQPAPMGVQGELCLGGAGVARGYLGQPGLTADRFVPDPFAAEPGARLYRSGDLARWGEDGTLEYLGRADHQVKIRGLRVELGEVEAQLYEHPSVRACVVVARHEEAGGSYLVGFVVVADGSLQAQNLRDWLGERLPVHLVPSVITVLDELPLTPSGKVDRRRLPSSGAPDRGGYVPPENALEQRLCRIWGAALGRDRVGRLDNFFDLGGHSLVAVRIAFSAQRDLGLPIKPASVLRHPTVARLAEHVASAMTASGGATDANPTDI
ncbi:amino acid adenylation domain-containing protein [Dactylosporangium sp. NPDC050588]|uniref:amino acid adenylation domain-containing protein n=1 Tax=Dactylosporangium sp. NPDC050588 TaxID=3157211 RepID=UPI00340A89FD